MTTLETLLTDPATAGVWNLVPDRCAITFKIRNIWGLLAVKGQFTDVSGDGQVTPNGAVFGRLDIRAGSLRTGIRPRDRHLHSADFFDVEHFPVISVVVTALQSTTGKAADVRASLTIKGITAPLSLTVTVTELEDGSVRVSGTTKIDRTQLGLTWNKFGMISRTATTSADVIFVQPRQ